MSGPNSVFAGNLPFSATDESLKEFFSSAGAITSAKIVTRGKGRSLGYGFVDFATGVSTAKVAADFHGKQMDGREIVCQVAKPKVEGEAKPERKPRAPRAPRAEGAAPANANANAGEARPEGERRRKRRPAPPKEKPPMIKENGLFIANLPFSVDGEGLKAIFNGSGVTVAGAHIITRRSGRSKGYGFAQFASEADRDRALKFATGKKLEDRELSVSAVQVKSDDA